MDVKTRKSKYVFAVQAALARRSHATNAQLATDVRYQYPDVSDTTIHRVTQRLLCVGECSAAPLDSCGARRFDNNLTPHDHFECERCMRLRDINLSAAFRREIQCEIGGCEVGGPLTVRGVCQDCLTR